MTGDAQNQRRFRELTDDQRVAFADASSNFREVVQNRNRAESNTSVAARVKKADPMPMHEARPMPTPLSVIHAERVKLSPTIICNCPRTRVVGVKYSAMPNLSGKLTCPRRTGNGIKTHRDKSRPDSKLGTGASDHPNNGPDRNPRSGLMPNLRWIISRRWTIDRIPSLLRMDEKEVPIKLRRTRRKTSDSSQIGISSNRAEATFRNALMMVIAVKSFRWIREIPSPNSEGVRTLNQTSVKDRAIGRVKKSRKLRPRRRSKVTAEEEIVITRAIAVTATANESQHQQPATGSLR